MTFRVRKSNGLVIALAIVLASTQLALGQQRAGCRVQKSPCYSGSAGGTITDGTGDTLGLDSDAPVLDQQPRASSNFFAQTGVMDTGSPMSYSPSMLGDFFANSVIWGSYNVPIAGGDRRFKISDNLSPIPRNRFFFNYHNFNNPVNDQLGQPRDVNRFTFGLEKALLDGLFSVEMRVPFTRGLDAEIDLGDDHRTGTEFGNMVLALKGLLHETRNSALAAGVAITFPTASDARILSGGITESEIDNETYYLQPYVGYLYTTERMFMQIYGAIDFVANGNGVYERGGSGNLTKIGTFQDQNLLAMDMQMGYWLFRNDCGDSYLTGIAPVIELHYNTTLQEADGIGPYQNEFVGNPFNRVDLLNLTAGVLVQMGPCSTLSVAAVVPLRREQLEDDYFRSDLSGLTPVFDSEIQVEFTRRF